MVSLPHLIASAMTIKSMQRDFIETRQTATSKTRVHTHIHTQQQCALGEIFQGLNLILRALLGAFPTQYKETCILTLYVLHST